MRVLLRRGVLSALSSLFATLIAVAAQACTPTYTIQPGDTLSAIAREQLGSLFDFGRIYEVNRDVIGDDPNLIFPDVILTIPCEIDVTEELDWSVMPGPDTIAALMAETDIQVLDIRPGDKVADGVLPGSVWIPYASWRGPEANPGAPPSAEKLSAMLGSAGLTLADPILIVHGQDTVMSTGRAARVYWLLKSSGAEQLAILRGGFDGWNDDADRRVAARPVSPTPRPLRVTFSEEWHADLVDVYGIAAGDQPGSLLDARPHGMFSRLDDAGRALATTLPGAQNAPAQALMSLMSGEVDIEAGAWRVIEFLEDQEIDWETGPVVSFCQTGELSALNWFYASELAALPGMKLYPDSVVGWTASGGVLAPGVDRRGG
ncbi:MAG: rhodanese-like domain-containing protein [Pseudomonadota bacterium]